MRRVPILSAAVAVFLPATPGSVLHTAAEDDQGAVQ